MVFRLLTLGLCVACVVFVATFDPVRVERIQAVAAPPPAAPERQLHGVDISASVAPSAIPALIGLARREWVKSVNDRETSDDYDAQRTMQALAHPGAYLDLTIGGDAPDRRVLVLVH